MSFYVATYLALSRIVPLALLQWVGVIAVAVATVGAVMIWERGRWPLGLFVPPRLASREFLLGCAIGSVIVGIAVFLVDVTTELRHEIGRGFPWLELIATFIPAVLHEELLFRGYAFQKMYRWHRRGAILFVAFIFAALHSGNESVTLLGLTNVFLGGVLLALAWERYQRLWLPIGIHLAWNLTSGPVTGHEVSGYVSEHTVLVTRGEGPDWITGGGFGVEGSVWLTVMEVISIVWLMKMNEERRTQNEE